MNPSRRRARIRSVNGGGKPLSCSRLAYRGTMAEAKLYCRRCRHFSPANSSACSNCGASDGLEPFRLEGKKSDGRFVRVWWPTLENTDDAKVAAYLGAGYALFIGSVSTILAISNITGLTHNWMGFGVLDCFVGVFYLVCAFFIFHMSRLAALLALVLYMGIKALLLNAGAATGGNVVSWILFGLFLVNGVRGTYTYHDFVAGSVETDNESEQGRVE